MEKRIKPGWTLFVVVIVIAAALSIATSAPPSRSSPTPKTRTACKADRHGLTYYRRAWNSWRSQRGVEERQLSGYFMPRGCGHVHYALSQWRQRAYSARMAYERWLSSQKVIHERAWWTDAVREAQKAYPGTEEWLLSCSSSEGGYGRFVMNSQGSGAGGWLQFMYGTFVSFYRSAHTDLQSRGFEVPESAYDWHSPTGQALAGAWGVSNGYSYHWSGYKC